jgi:alkylhydroperoxidase/carboxymuconolactone decarboxylase family protein YurZ
MSEATLLERMTDECAGVSEREMIEGIFRYAELDPALFGPFQDLRQAVMADGALSRKTKYLMATAVATTMRSEGALLTYARLAKAGGATKDEILEALRVGVLFSGGAGICAAVGIVDVLQED